jgi:hypothetical protein
MTANIRNGMTSAVEDAGYQEQNLVEKSSNLYIIVNNSAVIGNCAAI